MTTDRVFDRPMRQTIRIEKHEPGTSLDAPADSDETTVSWIDVDGTEITDEARIAELNRERDAERAAE
jgi:hypothetical protein